MNLRIISAGAGSGKTYRLTQELVGLLEAGVRPTGVVATTFTNKAAAELQERVRLKLLEAGHFRMADAISDALIGTVHSLGVKLLRRFSFEMGVSPQVDIIADEDHQIFFNQSLSTVLTEDRVNAIESLVTRFNLLDGHYDWRSELRKLIEAARVNGFSSEQIRQSRDRSWRELEALLPPVSDRTEAEWDRELAERIEQTLDELPGAGDGTKTTRTGMDTLQRLLWEWERSGQWAWHHWARIGKLRVGAKSREVVAPLQAFAESHEAHPRFRADLKTYLFYLFDLAVEAVEEYTRYKKERGLIDYTDMEVLVSKLLDRPDIQSILGEELDLLMVDEFQDTSPIQLDIFLKLSRLVDQAIWVGDPKQSIYGFRGADPQLMQAIVASVGGVQPEDIQDRSWRSREQLVYLANAIFTRAFPEIPEEQVALDPVRRPDEEPDGAGTALLHWYIDYDGEGPKPRAKAWTDRAIADMLLQRLEEGLWIKPKDASDWRLARPGDVAVLCRTNNNAMRMAEALHEAGLKASIARPGLLNSGESILLLACLRYLLSEEDSLAVAELLLLASRWQLEDIVEDRLDFLERPPNAREADWGASDPFIQKIARLREQTVDLSASETVNLVLDELQLRRISARMGDPERRLANLEELRKLALQYEDSCNRLHTAASLGGFLLWLTQLADREEDQQGAGAATDAVQVLTYHKSKGLEWPVVICHDLDSRLRTDLWGMTVLPRTEQIDLDNVLANRWIRYWVNPYGRQVQNTPLDRRLQESDWMETSRRLALAEEARLLYVGITRARDYLVIPQSISRGTDWLDRVWQQGADGLPTLDKQSPLTAFEWKGSALPKETRWSFFDSVIGAREQAEETTSFFPEPTGRVSRPPLERQAHALQEGVDFQIRSVQALTYDRPLVEDSATTTYALGKAVCAFLAADRATYQDSVRLEMAGDLLHNFRVEQELPPESLLSLGAQWTDFLQSRFDPVNEWRKVRLHHWANGQLFRHVLDLALETEQEWILVQHESFSGDAKQCAQWARKRAGLCRLQAEAWVDRSAGKKIRTFLHLPLSCRLIELVTQAATAPHSSNP